MIPNCVPSIAGNEIAYLKEAVETGWLSSAGPFVDRFEDQFSRYHGVSASAAVASGTAAIHLGLVSLGVNPGDLVICPTMTFIGSVNPICHCGAEPLFLDVEESTLNLDPVMLEAFFQDEVERATNGEAIHRQTGRRIAAAMVVHLYGNPADLDPISKLCDRYGVPILEDAAESLGARYGERFVGTIGDIGCFSFNGNKVITSGGGGMVISRDEEIVRFCKHLSTQAKSDPFEFVHDHLAFNYRLSNVCAAVGVAQLQELDAFIDRKRSHAQSYSERLKASGAPWEVVLEPRGSYGTYWMVLARYLDSEPENVLQVAKRWAGSGVGVRPLWKPLHTLSLFDQALHYGGEAAESVYASTICLPSSVDLKEEEIDVVVRTIKPMAGS